eukprot:3877485-Rhodomonas_salina.3
MRRPIAELAEADSGDLRRRARRRVAECGVPKARRAGSTRRMTASVSASSSDATPPPPTLSTRIWRRQPVSPYRTWRSISVPDVA